MSPSSPKGRKPGVRLFGFLLGVLLGVVLGGLGAAYWLESTGGDPPPDAERHSLLRARAELAALRAQNDALGGQLVMEESTRKGLEASLQSAQAELGRLRDQLAFFDQLLPPGPKGAISIRALEIERIGPNLLYRVLLQRSAQGESLFKGVLQFVAQGVRDGKEVKITLEAARSPGGSESVAPDTDGFALAFDQFQRGAGLLSLPGNFEPTSVTLNVLEGAAVRASRTIALSAAK
ncbi:DUF6776 family protein [Parapusillimonas granuli]|uniref:Uncharacterized protein n=1 Tax=Parapusillimonas granuli TaxID=380911 RepID=A0A853G1U4_9BURK|nr:DUF6776 family protein [Parapusillimonas granuli]MBB5215858.1 hypothetical protein [Parapusillimonas granuli]MEB2399451.1 hypothetical protein [Alcaligenaceae bacterium]NYT50843.1 hypothetical protein [Parapusillimonas granuli]